MTGDCFVAAFTHFKSLIDSGQSNGYTLVHGFVTRNSVGGRLVHAWVEREADGMVIDMSNGRVVQKPRDAYYETYGVEGAIRYTGSEACWMELATRHQGPWDESFDHHTR